MGKDWYRTVTSSSGGSAKSSKKCPGAKNRDTTATATSGGCMNAIFHFFDFHHLQFCLHQPPSSFTTPHENHSTVLKGMEAPRNSLELESEDEDEEVDKVSVLSSSKQNEKLHFPGMQIKTSCNNNGDARRSTSVDVSSEIGSSPATKTPTLVARLMGLDPLPDSCSSSSTPTSMKKKSRLQRVCRRQGNASGSRSLPETPRVSSSSSWSSVEGTDHRLSLQIVNKENAGEAFELSRFTTKRRSETRSSHEVDESRSSSEYARQVLKQVKESVSKRLGLTDITNSPVSRNQEQRRDQELLIKHLNLKKSPKLDTDSTKNSPRLSSKNKPATATTNNPHSQPAPPAKPLPSPARRSQENQKEVKKGERFRSRLIKKPPQKSDIIRKNKQEDPFVRPSSTSIKKATGKIIPVKKDNSSPVTKIVVIQSQVCDGDTRGPRRGGRSELCGSLGQEYKQPHTARDARKAGAASTTGDGGAQYHHYVTTILNRTPIHNNVYTSLDPSLFRQLELNYNPAPMATATDRKLVFHLVDEMLAQIFKPRPWRATTNYLCDKRGSELAETLYAKIGSFPAKECLVLGDIEEIVAGDLSEWEVRNVTTLGMEEEGERIVSDIERHVVDTLVYETAAIAISLGRFGGWWGLRGMGTRGGWEGFDWLWKVRQRNLEYVIHSLSSAVYKNVTFKMK